MIAMRVYRTVLRLLPVTLHRKHGGAMESLFARHVAEAREHGSMRVALTCVRSVSDVVVRVLYERLRPSPIPAGQTPMPTTRQLLRGHAASFAVSFVLFTIAMLSLNARYSVPRLHALGASTSTIAEALLLSLPFVAAMTIPMAVLFAVLQQFARLGSNGTLAAAQGVHDGARRLVLPVLAAAIGVAALAYAVTAELVPRTNQRLSAIYAGGPTGQHVREMTIAELREAARGEQVGTADAARVTMLEVEVQKKLALPAACIVFALAGMALAFRIPRGGTVLVVVASIAVYCMYYTLLVTGEALVDRQFVSPIVAMWGANAVLLTVALLLAWQRESRGTPGMPVRSS